ncbi:hypothetical protein OpiT1DRAFT_04080 [Opitutaceae bacterium TAV1]|nr:hypothetical protein OpiT1DRAFT_04080 [Opitutaceae bacterium TAV1]
MMFPTVAWVSRTPCLPFTCAWISRNVVSGFPRMIATTVATTSGPVETGPCPNTMPRASDTAARLSAAGPSPRCFIVLIFAYPAFRKCICKLTTESQNLPFRFSLCLCVSVVNVQESP